jgi:hypothetical protein
MFIRPSGRDLNAAVSAVDDVFDHGRPSGLANRGKYHMKSTLPT